MSNSCRECKGWIDGEKLVISGKGPLCLDCYTHLLPDEYEKLEAKVNELEAWKSDVMHVINESEGVAGYYKYGDIATWGELGLEGES